jgi:hypothetical protein
LIKGHYAKKFNLFIAHIGSISYYIILRRRILYQRRGVQHTVENIYSDAITLYGDGIYAIYANNSLFKAAATKNLGIYVEIGQLIGLVGVFVVLGIAALVLNIKLLRQMADYN